MALYIELLFVIVFLLVTCKIAIWPSMFDKNVTGSIADRIQEKRGFFIILSLTFLSGYLKWALKTGALISFFISAYILFLCTYICYLLANWKMKNEGKELKKVLDSSGYLRWFLAGCSLWLITALLYAIYIKHVGFERLSLSDFMNYSLLPWLTVAHELYPSKYLMRSRKVSYLLLLASTVDIVLLWVFYFR